MNKLRCCVIDDEPLAAGLIASYIKKTPFMELAGEFSSPHDAISTILDAGKGVDVVFLDIQMPQLNGVEFAKIIPPHTRVVFTTAYSNYAVDGFRVNALDYLLKPVSYDEFLSAANRALAWFDSNRPADGQPQAAAATAPATAADGADPTQDYFIIKSEYKLIQIRKSDILYIEGLKDYVRIYLDGADKSVMTLMSMKTLEQALPADRFMRVHRSFIVNLDRIKVIERNRIIIGKTAIPVSDSYKERFADYVAARSLNF